MTALRKSRSTGQIMAVITMEHDAAKGKTRTWAVLSRITRGEAFPPAWGFCMLETQRGQFHQNDKELCKQGPGVLPPAPVRWGRWESYCQVFSSQPWDLTYTLFSGRWGVCTLFAENQLPAQCLNSGLVGFFYWCSPNRRVEPVGLLIVWGCSSSKVLNNDNSNNNKKSLKKSLCLTILFLMFKLATSLINYHTTKSQSEINILGKCTHSNPVALHTLVLC